MDLETTVKLHIYDTLARTARAPTASGVARALKAPFDDVLAAFEGLHQKRLLVPEPGDPTRIRMAPPFSGVPTPFRVKVEEKAYYANCIWDALGVCAALRQDGTVETADAQSGEPMTVEIRQAQPVPRPCVVHFAVPAALWWEDVIYT